MHFNQRLYLIIFDCMTNHGLILILKTFTEAEINEFKIFIRSPYYNNRNAIVSLLDVIISYYPEFNFKHITKNELFGKVFPGKKFNDSTFRVILSGLNDLAVKFITLKKFESDNPAFNLTKIKALMERNVLTGLDKIFSESYSLLSKKGTVSVETFFHLHLFNTAESSYLSEKHSGVFDKILDKYGLESDMKNLLHYFYLKFMSRYVYMLNIEMLYNVRFEKEFIDKIFQSINPETFGNTAILQLYFHLVLMLKEKLNDNHYFKVKELFRKHKKTFHKNDVTEVIINMQNFCSRMISEGHRGFYKEKFEIYKTELKLKTYLIKGKMSPVYFISLVSLALKIKKTVWIKNFIENYSSKLDESIRINTVNYSLSLYEFELKNFRKAQEYLSVIKFTDLYQKLDLKVLQIMIYYEMNYTDNLISALEAFRHFLSNNKLIPESKYIYYSNFYKSVKKLNYFRQRKDEFGIKKFISELKSKSNFVNRNWILSKADELIKRE